MFLCLLCYQVPLISHRKNFRLERVKIQRKDIMRKTMVLYEYDGRFKLGEFDTKSLPSSSCFSLDVYMKIEDPIFRFEKLMGNLKGLPSHICKFYYVFEGDQ